MAEREAETSPESIGVERLPEWEPVRALVERCVLALSGRHPGLVAEAVVAELVASFALAPRESHWAERRRDHPERVRRLAHEAFRILEAEPEDRRAARRIAAGIVKAFTLAPRGGVEGGARDGA